MFGDLVIQHKAGEVRHVGAVCVGGQNRRDVGIRQLVAVRHLHKFVACVNEQRRIFALASLQHHDAGGDSRAEEQIVGKLDHTVYEVVIYQILADFLLCARTVEDGPESRQSPPFPTRLTNSASA